MVRAVLQAHAWHHRSNVTFWLECGSMLGGSLIRTARVARQLGRDDSLSLVAIDPFTGDVNMWAGEARAIATNARFRFLGLRGGQPTIYERFLANVARAGLRDAVLPIRATATVGLRLLARLLVSQTPGAWASVATATPPAGGDVCPLGHIFAELPRCAPGSSWSGPDFDA